MINSQPPSVSTCIETVARVAEVSFTEMLADRRSRAIARPRQVAMWLAKQVTLKSLPQISYVFNRDHTTILHGVKTIDRLRAEGNPYVLRLSNESLRKVMADPRQEEMAV